MVPRTDEKGKLVESPWERSDFSFLFACVIHQITPFFNEITRLGATPIGSTQSFFFSEQTCFIHLIISMYSGTITKADFPVNFTVG